MLFCRIDHAHHENLAKIALEEVVAFDKAIETATELTKDEDTLIVVTADHSHSMSMNGYPKRGNPIEGMFGLNINISNCNPPNSILSPIQGYVSSIAT